MSHDELESLLREFSSLRLTRRSVEWSERDGDAEYAAIRRAEVALRERRLRERLSGLSLRDALGDLLDDPVSGEDAG